MLQQQNKATVAKLFGTLATAASLRSRGGGGGGGGEGLISRGGEEAFRSRGGGGLRSKGEPTYLVGAAAVILVSGGRTESHVTGGAGYQWSRKRVEGRERAPAGGRSGSELGVASVPAGEAVVEWRGTTTRVSEERISMSAGDGVWQGRVGSTQLWVRPFLFGRL
jgi:hypothetical protein